MAKRGDFFPWRTAYTWDPASDNPASGVQTHHSLDSAVLAAATQLRIAVNQDRGIRIDFVEVGPDKTRRTVATVDQELVRAIIEGDDPFDWQPGQQRVEDVVLQAVRDAQRADASPRPAPAKHAAVPAAPKPGQKGFVYPYRVRYCSPSGKATTIVCADRDRVVDKVTKVLRTASRAGAQVAVWIDAVDPATRTTTTVISRSAALHPSLFKGIPDSSTMRDRDEVRRALGLPRD
jgi:hypothetical protein